MRKELLKVKALKLQYEYISRGYIGTFDPKTNDYTDDFAKRLKDFEDGLSLDEKKFLSNFVNLKRRTHNSLRAWTQREYEEKKSLVTYLGGGWYSFSANSHKDYSGVNDIKVHGRKKLIQALNEYGRVGIFWHGLPVKGLSKGDQVNSFSLNLNNLGNEF